MLTKMYKSSNDMEAQMLEILNAVQEGTKSPTQAQSELLLLYSVMAGQDGTDAIAQRIKGTPGITKIEIYEKCSFGKRWQ